jgi:hypothetical protein
MKISEIEQGMLVIYEGLPYIVGEVDEDDLIIYLYSGDEEDTGFWVDPDDIEKSYIPKKRNGFTRKNFILEIEVNNGELKKKYPNYRFNFDVPEQFIEMLVKEIGQDKMMEYGYSVKVKPI